MSIAFLAPLYLLGLLGISIPVILHLLHKRPQRVHDFPTLRFLLKKRMVADRQRNLKRLLILLLRTLAIAALALAFAYPILRKVLPKQPKGVVILLDTSASMQLGARWEKALAFAGDEVEAATRSGASVGLVAFDREARTLQGFNQESASNPQTLLNTLKPGFGGTNPAAAMRLADRLLMDEAFDSREVVVISDFSGAGWVASEVRGSLSHGITLRCLDPAEPPPESNFAVQGLEMPRAIYSAGEAVTLKARVRNFSQTPRQVKVTLKAQQRPESAALETDIPGLQHTGERSTLLPAFADTTVEFNLITKSPGTLSGSVSLVDLASGTDAFLPDDARYFVVPGNEPAVIARLRAEPDATVKTKEGDKPNEPRDVFLSTAFAPFFERENRRFTWTKPAWSAGQPLELEKTRAELVMLDQGLELKPEQAEELAAFVKGGGKLLLFLGEADALQEWEKKLLGGAIDLGRAREAGSALRDKMAKPTFARVNLTHPLLTPFNEPGTGNLFATEVQRWREFTLAPDRGEALISLQDGKPLVAMFPLEQGQVMVWAFPPEREWSTWPLQTSFLPFLYRYAEFAASGEGAHSRFNHTVGDLLDAESGAVAAQPGIVAETSAAPRAVNLDAAESDFERSASLELLPTLAASEAPASAQAGPGLAQTFDPAQNPSARWILWLLVGVLIFSFGELLLANRTAT